MSGEKHRHSALQEQTYHKPTVTTTDAIMNVEKELTGALKDNILTTLEGSSLEDLAKLEAICFATSKAIQSNKRSRSATYKGAGGPCITT